MGFAKKAVNQTLGFLGLGSHHKKAASVDPASQIPTTDVDTAAFPARDIMRRMAKRANGRDSTIRTSAAGVLYDAQPKQLLGS